MCFTNIKPKLLKKTRKITFNELIYNLKNTFMLCLTLKNTGSVNDFFGSDAHQASNSKPATPSSCISYFKMSSLALRINSNLNECCSIDT